MTPDTTILIDPSGQIVEHPTADLGSLGGLGYVRASPEQIKDFELEKKYSTGTEAAKAFGEHAASALTFGASDWAERGLGVSTPEAMAAREKFNPVASGLGTATGIALPLVATLGAAGPAEGALGAAQGAAKLSAPSLVSRLGQAATRAAEATLPESAGKIVSAIPGTIGSSIEGAAYGLGQVVHESALGDPHLTAQSAIAQIGLSAALGGGLGAAVGLAEEGIPILVKQGREAISGAFKKAGKGIEGVYSNAEALTGTPPSVATLMLEHKQEIAGLERIIPGVGEEIGSATPEMAKWIVDNGGRLAEFEKAFPGTTRKLARVDPATADYLLQNWPKIWTDPNARAAAASTMADDMQGVVDTVNKLQRRLNSELFPAEIEHLAGEANPAAVEAAYGSLFDSVAGVAQEMRSSPELFGAGYAKHLEDLAKGMVRDVDQAITPAEAFRRIRTLRQTLDEAIPYTRDTGALGFSERNAIQKLKKLRAEVKATLVDESVFGPVAARQSALDAAQSEWLSLTGKGKPFNKAFMEKVEGRGGVSYKMKATKLNTLLRQGEDARALDNHEIWGRTMDAARKLMDEAEASFKAAPVGEFDRPALDSVINKSADITAKARQEAAATWHMNELNPAKHPFGSNIVSPGADAAMGAMSAVAPGFVTSTVKATLNAANSVKSVPRMVATLAWLERAGQSVGNKIEAGASTLVRGGTKASLVGRGEVASGLARSFGQPADEAAAQHLRRITEVSRLAQDPAQLQATLEKQADGVHEHAPNTAQALQVASARAVAFLHSKVPARPQLGPLGPKISPSPSDVAKFNRYYEAVNRPNSILKQAAAGTLTPEAVEAVRTVYPELFAKMQQSIAEKIASHPGTVPYRSRLMLAMFLGQDMDGSTTPAAIVAHQAALRGPSHRGPMDQLAGGGRSAQGGLGKLKVSGRMLTSMQASAQRGR